MPRKYISKRQKHLNEKKKLTIQQIFTKIFKQEHDNQHWKKTKVPCELVKFLVVANYLPTLAHEFSSVQQKKSRIQNWLNTFKKEYKMRRMNQLF